MNSKEMEVFAQEVAEQTGKICEIEDTDTQFCGIMECVNVVKIGDYHYRILREAKQTSRPLTLREKQVLTLTLAGKTNKQIAFELGVKPSTISPFIHRLIDKFEVQNRQQLCNLFDVR